MLSLYSIIPHFGIPVCNPFWEIWESSAIIHVGLMSYGRAMYHEHTPSRKPTPGAIMQGVGHRGRARQAERPTACSSSWVI